MLSGAIATQLREKPFLPFRIRTLDGHCYTVASAEAVTFDQQTITVDVADPEGRRLRRDTLTLAHLVAVEVDELEAPKELQE